MKVKKTVPSSKKRSSDNFPILYQIIAIFVVAALALLFFLWHKSNKEIIVNSETARENILNEDMPIPEQTAMGGEEHDSNGYQFEEKNEISSRDLQSPTGTENPDNIIIGNRNGITTGNALPKNTETTITTGIVSPPALETSPAVQEKNGTISEKCTTSVNHIRQFYRHLDQQEYLQNYDLDPGSEVYFTQVIQGLLDNPPVVSGETNDLYTILKNTAHFFRVIGKTNILILKAILDRENDQFENILAHYYTMLHQPACLEQHFSLQLSESSLYEYAGFFLSTMGGRLYLFRRDSLSRMVVSYYAILLIDKANKAGTNKHGIEIALAIDQLINEIESTANTLQLQETYLDTLYTLKEEYQYQLQ
ncbi:MAG: hypothetical protein V2I36_12630 [Desulfopila sp.]|jgi:hypothetical protein|nr:hypothetical protein [Desulfopila sp.]